MPEREPEPIETVVIGGGQAGLSVGHHLARRGRPFLILDANQRIGDAWRRRWDSLRLFTPARYDALAGLRCPRRPTRSPARTRWPTTWRPTRPGSSSRSGPVSAWTVSGGTTAGSWSPLETGAGRPTTSWSPCRPSRSPGAPVRRRAGPGHPAAPLQRLPAPLPAAGGPGAGGRRGNSGAEIALELAGRHPTWLAGKESGHVPFRIEGAAARYVFQPLLFRVVGHRVLTVDTPIGRRLRPRLLAHGAPLVRVRPKDLAAAGIQRVPRVVGVRDGHP